MSSITLEELKVVIDAELAPFRKKIQAMKQETKSAKDAVADFNTNVKKQTAGISNSFAGLKRTLVALGIGTALVQLSKYSTQMAIEVEAAMNQVKRTMGESSQVFLKWAENNAIAFNMSRGEATKYGAVYSNLLGSFISDTENLTGYTTELLKASSIVASNTGRTMQDVMERMRSGLLGNTEAIEDLGVMVNVSMIESTNAFKQFAGDSSWSQLDFQTQQQIRLMAILEQVTARYGTSVAQNTNTSLAMLTALLKDTALNIGNALLPVLNVIIPVLTSFASVLRTVTGHLATFMQMLFGKSISASGGGSAISSAAADASSLGDSLGGASDNAGSLGKGVDGVGKSAKKAAKEMKALMGFDELNILKSPSNSDSDAGSGTGSGSGGSGAGSGANILPSISVDADLFEEDNSKIAKAVAKLKELLQPTIEAIGRLKEALQPLKTFVATGLIDFYNLFLKPVGVWVLGEGLPRFIDIISKTLNNINFPKINEALRGLWEALAPYAINVGEGVLWFLDNVLSPLTSWTISEVVPIFLDGLAAVINILNTAIEAQEEPTQWLFDNLLSPIASWTGGVIVDVLKAVVDALKAFGDWASEHKELIGDIAIVIGSFATAWVIVTGAIKAWQTAAAVASAVTAGLSAAITFLTSPVAIVILVIGALIAIGVLLWKNWDTVKEKATQIWNSLSEFFKTTTANIGKFFSDLWKGISITFKNVGKWFTEKFQAAKTGVTNAFSSIGTWFKGKYSEITNTFKNIGTWFGSKFREGMTGIRNAFSGIGSFFGTMWSNIVSRFSDIGTKIGSAVGSAFRSIVNGVLGTIDRTVNGFIGMINGAVSLINKIPGVNIGRVGYINIPRLAKGGILDEPTIAMVGEAGKEAVMPLENNTGWISDLADKIRDRMGGNEENGGGDLEISLELDNAKLGKAVIKNFRQITKQTGRNPVLSL